MFVRLLPFVCHNDKYPDFYFIAKRRPIGGYGVRGSVFGIPTTEPRTTAHPKFTIRLLKPAGAIYVKNKHKELERYWHISF